MREREREGERERGNKEHSETCMPPPHTLTRTHTHTHIHTPTYNANESCTGPMIADSFIIIYSIDLEVMEPCKVLTGRYREVGNTWWGLKCLPGGHLTRGRCQDQTPVTAVFAMSMSKKKNLNMGAARSRGRSPLCMLAVNSEVVVPCCP